MIELKGKYTDAIIYQDRENIEDLCIEQIQTIIDSPAYENCKIRIMPDCHVGVGICIGATIQLKNRVIPGTVGVDIGCGMYLVALKGLNKETFDFAAFDNFIRTHIPCGREINDSRQAKFDKIKELYCFRELKDTIKFERAIGTLGGGNHFHEIDCDDEGNLYFVVHTGSRNLGKQVADYYQNLADGICNRGLDAYFIEKTNIIDTYKKEGRKQEIQKALIALKEKYKENLNKVPKDLAYLEGKYFEDYIHDMKICQEYAHLNRETIVKKVCEFLGVDFDSAEKFETLHNYIDTDSMILRKGAINCSLGKKVLIPINMKDGSLICEGLGNPDYNFSGPHGAGRLMSRTQAKETIKLEDFEDSMKGIYTTCVGKDTIDESCFAYKTLDMILPNIKDTVNVIKRIVPIYNFKAME